MVLKNTSIVGFGKNRAANDFYPTPTYVTEALLERETFSKGILEPASGDGAISKVLESKGYKVLSMDIREDDDVYGIKGCDFLNETNITNCPNIITNPPYKLATEFVLKAKEIANEKIAMFLKLAFLEGAKRHDLFKDTKFPLQKVYVFCRRVTIAPKGVVPKNSGLIAYAWYVWSKDHKGEATIDWIL